MPRKDKKKEEKDKSSSKDKSKGKGKGKHHKDDKSKGKGKGKEEKPTKPTPTEKKEKETPAQPAAAASSSSAAPASSKKKGDTTSLGGLTHMSMLKNPGLCDVSFQTHGAHGNKQVMAHLSVLNVRSAHLAGLVNKVRAKKRRGFFQPTTVDLSKQVSDVTMEVILEFLYGDNLNFHVSPLIDPVVVLNVCVAANQFKLDRLVRLCRDHLRATIDLKNVFVLLKSSHELKEEVVFKFCMNFSHQNIKKFVQHRDEINTLGMQLFQDVVIQGLEEYEPLPEETSEVPPSTLIEDFQKLHDDTAGNAASAGPDSFVSINGKKIYFHKAVLAAHSHRFAGLMNPTPKLDDMSEVLFKNLTLTPESFQAMLAYIYYGKSDIEPLVAGNLAPFCNAYGLSSLQQICESHVAGNLQADNVIPALAVAYREENMERSDMKALRENGVKYVLQNLKDIDVQPLAELDIQIAVDILQAWKAEQ